MSPSGARRGARIPKQIAISLIGSDWDGRVFSEQTKTVLLSRHGAGIVSQYKLSPEQEIILRRIDTGREAEARVVGEIGEQENGHTYGVAFLDEGISLWSEDFPAEPDSQNRAKLLVLECDRCQNFVEFDEDAIESDVHAVNEGVLRYCRVCNCTTNWKASTTAPGSRPGRQQIPWSAPKVPAMERPQTADTLVVVAEPAPETPAANRRKHRRTRVNYQACIRRSGFENDIVVCEDMSRGGLRFKSEKKYFTNTYIEIAVPYSPNSPPIFVPGTIVFVCELENERLFRCGVSYGPAFHNS